MISTVVKKTWHILLPPLIAESGIPKIVTRFEEAGFNELLTDWLEDASFQKPTPIQMQAWPVTMSGRDVVGIAETGSGKSVAYLFPVFRHIGFHIQYDNKDPKLGPIALILVPTRELVDQVVKQVKDVYAKAYATTTAEDKTEEKYVDVAERGLKVVGIFGGENNKREQKEQLTSSPVDLLVATPGRLLDFISVGMCMQGGK